MPLDVETRSLIERYQSGDRSAADALLRMHDPWCHLQARKAFRTFGIDFDDALQAARLGLVDAASAFDLTRETGLLTYAAYRVRKRVADARAERLGGSSNYILTLGYKIAKAERDLTAEGSPVTDETIAAKTGMQAATVIAAKARRRTVSMDAPLNDDEGGTMHDVLAAPTELQPDRLVEVGEEEMALRAALRAAIDTSLSERRAEIMHAWLDAECEPGAQTAIAVKLGVTRQMVSLTIIKSMPMLQRALRLNGYGPGRVRGIAD